MGDKHGIHESRHERRQLHYADLEREWDEERKAVVGRASEILSQASDPDDADPEC